VHGHDRLVSERPEEAGLAASALDDVGRGLRRQFRHEFQLHDAVERFKSRSIDDPHPAATDLAVEDKVIDARARLERRVARHSHELEGVERATLALVEASANPLAPIQERSSSSLSTQAASALLKRTDTVLSSIPRHSAASRPESPSKLRS